MTLLSIAQLKTHLYGETQTLISRADDSIVQAAIDAAIAEAKGYCSRYRTDLLFDNVADADPILLMHVKNIAKWHFINLSNPNIDYDDAQKRYEQAIDWLKLIQSGKVMPQGWQAAQPEENATFFHVQSNDKRNNHF